MNEDLARQALKELLWELPMEFSTRDTSHPRESFSVIKSRNVLKVHRSLIDLQEYFGLLEPLDNEDPDVVD